MLVALQGVMKNALWFCLGFVCLFIPTVVVVLSLCLSGGLGPHTKAVADWAIGR